MTVTIRFLGGLGEIGRNCLAIEDQGSALIIDAGLYFPELRAYGIDIALPDFRALQGISDRVAGIVLTHGHEDHVGALGELSKMVSAPVFGSRTTLAIASKRLQEAGSTNTLQEVSDYSTVTIGPFDVTFLPVAHSVPDSCALVVKTSEGLIYHTGDFKLDPTPLDARTTDLRPLQHLGVSGQIELLLIDATNAEEPGWTESEMAVRPAIHDVFQRSTGQRIICTCFASHIHRVMQLLAEARMSGRRVAAAGRSMTRIFEIIDRMDLLDLDEHNVIDIREISDFEPGEICIIATGGQGEPRAALALMARGDHRQVKVAEGDVVLMSSDAIPGNESAVGHLIDQLTRRGAEVVHAGSRKVHVSGHAKADELRDVIRLAQPKAVIPIHGEYRHMDALRRIAEAEVPDARVMVVEDGTEVTLRDGELTVSDNFPAPYIYRSNTNSSDVSAGLIRERQSLQSGGVLIVFLTVDEQGTATAVVDQVGWLNDRLFSALRDDLRQQILHFFAVAQERAVRQDDLENHLSARMRKHAQRLAGTTPHVAIILEAPND